MHTKNTGAGHKASFRWNFEMARAGDTGGCASAYTEREFLREGRCRLGSHRLLGVAVGFGLEDLEAAVGVEHHDGRDAFVRVLGNFGGRRGAQNGHAVFLGRRLWRDRRTLAVGHRRFVFFRTVALAVLADIGRVGRRGFGGSARLGGRVGCG